MTLQDLLLTQFKVKTRANINPEISTLTGGVDKVLSNNPNRLAWIIINLGDDATYLSFERDPSSTKAIILSGGGGSASMLWNEDFDLVGYELFGKGTQNQTLYVIEILTAE